jgi:hypothetical protein
VGSAPQASEPVFREGPDDIVCVVSKGACAGNVGWKPKPGGPGNWESAVRQGAGLYPDAVPTRRKKKERKQMRTEPTGDSGERQVNHVYQTI